jgi:surface polysaccharide O-acyltransferase-like enzyme
MTGTVTIFVIGGLFVLASTTLSIINIVQELRISLKHGVIAMVAPVTLTIGLLMTTFAAHLLVVEKIESNEANKQGVEEMERQIEKIDQIDPDQMQLDL